MAIDKNSNGYTFGFAIAMVVVVGALLSVAAMSLKPFQKKNVELEKKQNILASIKINCSREEAKDLFDKHVLEQVVIDYQGNKVEGQSAFDIDIKKQYKEIKAKAKTPEQAVYPLFVCDNNGTKLYVVPLVGTGLWGPIWGFISLGDDLNTVYGATFDHKTETPGLGAEIKYPLFSDQFEGDVIYTDGEVSMKVLKGGGGDSDPSAVDGITGGTITSVGVQDMIQNTFAVYGPYFNKQKS